MDKLLGKPWGKLSTFAIVVLTLSLSATSLQAKSDRAGAQKANEQTDLPAAPDPVVVEKWIGHAVGDILTVPEKVLKDPAR